MDRAETKAGPLFLDRLAAILRDIKVEHTVFALPFAFMGAALAERSFPTAAKTALILLAMVGARSAAMAFNRLVDASLDAKNPRTKTRALPSGAVKKREVALFVAVSVALFLLAARLLNPLSFRLAPIALLVILGYSFTKRFTRLTHLFLGLSLGLTPAAGYIAVKGSIAAAPVVLGAGVIFWVAGFDIIYACLDYDFDRKTGVHSIPGCIGVGPGLRVAALFHGLATLLFLATGIVASLGLAYYLGVGIVALCLLYEHSIVSPKDLGRVNTAFFTVNGVVSLVLFASTLLAL